MKITLLSFTLLLFSSFLFSQESPNIVTLSSLDHAFQKALKSNPRQNIYRLRTRQAIYNHKSALGFLLPSASGTFNGTDNLSLGVTPVPGELVGEPGTTFYAQFGKRYNYNAGLNLSQVLFDWQVIQETAIAKKNIELSQADELSFTQKLKEQVAQVYFTTLIAKSAVKLAEMDEMLADSLVQIAKQSFAHGSTDQLILNQSIINANQIQQNKTRSYNLYEQGKENLKLLLGENPLDKIELKEELQRITSTVADLNIIGKDQSLDSYRVQAEIAVLKSKSQRAIAYPKFLASAYFGGQQFRNDLGLSLKDNAWSRYQYIGVGLSIPFFTGFTNSNKYKSSKVQSDITQLQYTEAKRTTAINDKMLLKNLDTQYQLAGSSLANFELYGSTLQLSRQKHMEGLISMDIYFKTFMDYLNAENLYLNDLSQLYTIKAILISRQ